MEVSEELVDRFKRERLQKCDEIIRNDTQEQGLVSIVLLSCKRPQPLLRLLHSMGDWPRLECINFETWFVDNGSDFSEPIKSTIEGRFRKVVWHPHNIGMGPAINDILSRVNGEFVLFLEDDLIMSDKTPFLDLCVRLFRKELTVGIIKLKDKHGWDKKPYRKISKPRFLYYDTDPYRIWLPSNRWDIPNGNRPWFAGIHNVWSLGPVMFRHCAWKENGPLPVAQGRGQAIAAEDVYARTFNDKWLAARFEYIRPFSQPVTEQSPGYHDKV